MMKKKSDKNYFEQLNSTLKNHHRAIPFLVVDLDRVDENIELFKADLKSNAHFRVVVKSLPSPNLLNYVAEKMNTNRFMVFHQPFLSHLSTILDSKADILLGKPMPIKTAAFFFKNFPKSKNDFNPYSQIQWLVDTKKRALEYLKLAEELKQTLRLNLEIDVGLHRGGFQTLSEVKDVLEIIKASGGKIEFSGFMGYDPHVVKVPKILRSQKKSLSSSNNFYNDSKRMVEEQFSELWNDRLTFNGAGSPTVRLHNTSSSPLNDVAAGSCFVKPSTFDVPTLSNYSPACFIATPVLKKMKDTTIPGLEKFKTLLRFINRKNAQSFFIYGGFWKADYVFPEDLQLNTLFGASTNQTMVNAPMTANLEVDDFVFLRPHQSEFVFLQFGKLMITRGNEIVDEWGVLDSD
ncbi:alanine racemase [Brumimicrobium oceani]|uniref:Alanine racemase n=1 Tax=Brumimicrobium oceani TaxID=2100725 RepID=A0A2U2XCX4_9FLAO|nr:alanine racemase [Brumimicrobium oceani]PWH85645.1 alanine racemase [Brumimicrobium oceani]